MNEIQSLTSSLVRLTLHKLADIKNIYSKENVKGMSIAVNEKNGEKVPFCEYTKVETILGEFELSIRE